jgi:hypothetical protein
MELEGRESGRGVDVENVEARVASTAGGALEEVERLGGSQEEEFCCEELKNKFPWAG